MSRTLFENSKAALAFAAITLIGAVSMVGTSEDGGMLPKLAERFGNKPDNAPMAGDAEAEATLKVARVPEKKQVEGWYDTPPGPVFGDFKGDETPTETASEPEPASQPGSASIPQPVRSRPTGGRPPSASGPANNPMTAPLSPTAVIPAD